MDEPIVGDMDPPTSSATTPTNPPDSPGSPLRSVVPGETLIDPINMTRDAMDQPGHGVKVRLPGDGAPKVTPPDLPDTLTPDSATLALPWGLPRRISSTQIPQFDNSMKPGEFVLKNLFREFTYMAEGKLQLIAEQGKDKPLSKYLQRGEDPDLDQLLNSFSSVAEHCLPSLLTVMFKWYELQNGSESGNKQRMKKVEKNPVQERRELAVDFLFCLVVIEVIKQLGYHPGHDNLVTQIIDQAFRHFKYKEGSQSSPNAADLNIIADLYAEVIGVLAHSRFLSVKKKFMNELRELKMRDQTPYITHSIISLLMGMKFFRVKMHPIEEFEACFQFLHECGSYFLEVKDKDIKHALAGLFVEILLPVAAVVKNEVNVPVLKNFVETLYQTTLDLSTKKKHCLALFPMVTCLLCVSPKPFFLQNWPVFLAMCLSNLKNKDPKMARVALESLYRLLWVYMVRIKCESNTATQSRLQSIMNSLFPKGSKVVMPRDVPLNIFVKIIQFVAQERLDFTMKEIIFDLLCVGKPIKFLTPERMSIGLRSFLVIADNLEKNDGVPPMPQTIGVLPSGNTLRVKKTFLNTMLTEDTAKSIGMAPYYQHVRKAFDAILRALDAQVGRHWLITKQENQGKDADDMITGERKPKIDLFRTSIAAIPRLIPDGMTHQELVELLSRLTVHLDEELKGLAFQALQNLIVDFPSWREHVLHGFIQFVLKEVNDSFPHVLDNALRMTVQFVNQWKNVASPSNGKEKPETPQSLLRSKPNFEKTLHANVLNEVEAFGLCLLCNCRPTTRKLAVSLLRETRNLYNLLGTSKVDDPCVVDVIDRSCPAVVEVVLPHLPTQEKAAVLAANNIDLHWLAERGSSFWGIHYHDNYSDSIPKTMDYSGFDAWISCMSTFLSGAHVYASCPTAMAYLWPMVYSRLLAVYTHVDPNNVVNDNRASSLLRSGSKKVTNERDMYMSLWHNYVVMSCCIAPLTASNIPRSASPELSPFHSSSPESTTSERSEVKPSQGKASSLFKLLVPLIRCDLTDMRDISVNGLGKINAGAFSDLMEELVPYIKEAIDRKQENMRRRRRRDTLRVQLAKIFHLMAERGTFAQSPMGVTDSDSRALTSRFVEYIDGARMFLENEAERDLPILQEIRLHFSGFIRHLIRHTILENRQTLLSRSLRYNLFYLFASWTGKYGRVFGAMDRRSSKDEDVEELELSAMQAMSSVLTCGAVFDTSGLTEDGYIYLWLDTLLEAKNQSHHSDSNTHKVYLLAQETIVLLLEFNPDSQALLDWVIDRCYTASDAIADGCFNALTTVFSNKEYPCDHVAMLCVTLLMTGNPRVQIQDTALELLQLLDRRFFLDDVVMDPGATAASTGPDEDEQSLVDRGWCEVLLGPTYAFSQMELSHQLAKLHPELTMPIFSEITHRVQTSRYPLQKNLLQMLLPWLLNMELIDPHLPAEPLSNFLNKIQDAQVDGFKAPLSGEGWGSPQATEMLLNNLFYLTVKFGDDHPNEMELCWATLVQCWPGNLKVILRYLVIVTGMALNELLPFSRRVIVYLGRAKPEKVVDELMEEMQTVETLNFNVERTHTPPFYRLTTLKKPVNPIMLAQSEAIQSVDTESLERGVLHTKRHSTIDDKEGSRTASVRSNTSVATVTSGGSTSSNTMEDKFQSYSSATTCTTSSEMSPDEDNFATLRRASESKSRTSQVTMATTGSSLPTVPSTGAGLNVVDHGDYILPYPLPMPAYGGFYAPMSKYLNDTPPSPGFHRCNMAVMMITDLVMDAKDVDWAAHLPLMLHIIFLGMDHPKSAVHESCKKLLLNLLVVLSAHNDHNNVAKILLSNKSVNEEFCLSVPTPASREYNFISKGDTASVAGIGQSTFSINSQATITPDSVSKVVDLDSMPMLDEIASAMVEFIATRKCHPLWSCEDITSKTLSIVSAEQIERFLQYVIRVFRESLPMALIEERWGQIALNLALSCSSRHYAGRSFQIFRALHIALTSRMLTDILSRLVETVAEQGEDMQGYVTEIMLTLEAAIDNFDMEFRPVDFARELFKSTPNLSKEARERKGTTVAMRQHGPHYHPNKAARHSVAYHIRSTSYTMTPAMRRATVGSHGDYDDGNHSNLHRSRSAQSLKNISDLTSQDDRLQILSQMFWLSVCLMESDYEYEFMLAIRLIQKVFKHLQPDRPECREKLDKILQQMNWMSYPGVQAMLLKGCTSATTAEATWLLLSKLTTCIQAPVVDPGQKLGFPMNVIALLPYMVINYESPNNVCKDAAENISQVCMDRRPSLDNLSTVMTLYSRGTFARDSLQWTKCVVKYLLDGYSHVSNEITAYLLEILERGPNTIQVAVLHVLYCMVHYIELTSNLVQSVSSELLRVITKFIQSPHWKEALKILKLVVAKSSSLTQAPSGHSSMSANVDYTHGAFSATGYTSFVETDVSMKKELPGRTLEFSFDFGCVPHLIVAGGGVEGAHTSTSNNTDNTSEDKNKAETPTSSTGTNDSLTGWKRPYLSQGRTRERLVNLLTSFGQRVGLPKSPSELTIRMRRGSAFYNEVIFSQSSDTIDRQPSMCSSSEEASIADGRADDRHDDSSSSEQQFHVFRDFDFLDIEYDTENENTDKFNWGVKRHSLSNLDDVMSGGRSPKESRSGQCSAREESSDDEGPAVSSVGSVSPIDDVLRHDMSDSSNLTIENLTIQNQQHEATSPMSESTHSIHSMGSDVDASDLSPCNVSPSFSLLTGSFSHVQQRDMIDEVWKAHISLVIVNSMGLRACETFHLFPSLYKETLRKLSSLTRESCFHLSKEERLRPISNQFLTMLDIMMTQTECPFIHLDTELLVTCKLVDRHRLCVMEINECYETYMGRKEQTVESLDEMKSSIKLRSLGEYVGGDFGADEQKIELCRSLYKLHYQLLLVFQSYCKLVHLLESASEEEQVTDVSDDISRLQKEMSRALRDSDSNPNSPLNMDGTARHQTETMIFDCIRDKEYCKAVKIMRAMRSMWQSNVAFPSGDEDVAQLLYIYCHQLVPQKQNTMVLAVIHPEHDINHAFRHMMLMKIQISESIKQVEQAADADREVIVRQPETSSL